MHKQEDAAERQVIEDVENYGWHVINVMEASDSPAFAYTIGLHHSFQHPELIVVGLLLGVAHSVLNIAGEAIRRGARYSEGTVSDDFLEDRLCIFRSMPEAQYSNYFGGALWFYDGVEFPALQLVWADNEGRWPWEAAVDPLVRENQPVIEVQGDPPWAHCPAG